MLRHLQSSNQSLDQSCRSLLSDIEELEHERRAVIKQTQLESDMLHRQRHQCVDPSGDRGLLPVHQNFNISHPATPALSEPYSWASSLVGGAIGSPGFVGGRA